MRKNILIYPHLPYNMSDGGTTVQYYLAKILRKLGENVKIYNSKGKTINNIFCDYVDSITKEELENTVVIYCEGIRGNPLNAKYVVRWMLSELGKNVPVNWAKTWDKNELVYYFNPEPKFDRHCDFVGSMYKSLYVIYINPEIKNLNLKKEGWCHTFRKSSYHTELKTFHPDNSFEITRNHTQNDYIEIFNRHKYFVSYDPLTFLNIIALLCGCISIVYPIKNMTKKEWIKNTSIGDFINKTNGEIYGIAYGNSKEEFEYAEKTIHLAENQFNNLEQFTVDKNIVPFLNDIHNFENNINTVENNFFDNNNNNISNTNNKKNIEKNAKITTNIIQKGVIQKGVIQKGVIQKDIIQKGIIQKDIIQKDVIQKDIIQKGIIQKDIIQKGIMYNVIINKKTLVKK